MAASTPLTLNQARLLMSEIRGTQTTRNRAIFALGCATGMRISELLCLQINDILNPNGGFKKSIKMTNKIYDRLKKITKVSKLEDSEKEGNIKKKSTKQHTGQIQVRPLCHKYLEELLEQLYSRGYQQPSDYLFTTSTGKIVTREHMYYVFRNAAERAGIFQTVGTHSMRKSYAQDMFYLIDKASKDNPNIKPMVMLKKALRHKRFDSTLSYLQFLDEDISQFTDQETFNI